MDANAGDTSPNVDDVIECGRLHDRSGKHRSLAMRSRLRLPRFCAFALALMLTPVGASSAAAQSSTSVEKLLEQGWEIAGYVSAWENRSLILFRHKDHKYLVQCSVLIDVLRTPRMVTYCYEIR